jgi:hypothetical protein
MTNSNVTKRAMALLAELDESYVSPEPPGSAGEAFQRQQLAAVLRFVEAERQLEQARCVAIVEESIAARMREHWMHEEELWALQAVQAKIEQGEGGGCD